MDEVLYLKKGIIFKAMRKNAKTWVIAVLFIAYVVVLVRVFVFKDFTLRIFHLRFRVASGKTYGIVNNNFVPFKTISLYLHGHQGGVITLGNLLGNIIPFIPIGVLLPLLFRSISWKGVLAAAIAFSFSIEILQFLMQLGSFDVDDILLNTVGVMLGLLLFVLVVKWMLHQQVQ